ncbi:hypothetical protein HYALB_00004934 [Hymenoscyphus albidus]|uniref:Putative peptidase domain-containing protein n=1 Tax=Hymenoscyphus albidus TaxID=595503 RepID=A0A9N9LDF4_9HELO|nr:hypothetical protein HYALB_00004934 [Hymenoscyphus albidus]
MYTSTILVGLFSQAAFSAVLPVPIASRDTPLSFVPGTPAQVPVSNAYDWRAGYVSEFTIHGSCNATERNQISQGLDEAVLLAQHAKEHILVQGNKSEIFQKYFGAGPTGPVIGWFDRIATANRAGVLFRCDDPDQNCATQDNWAGHHRGSNASSETVICERSYTTRLPLASLCSRGFTIANGRMADYWGGDLIHRLYHTSPVGEEIIDHHADGYNNCLELAKGENYTLAASNSATLLYFAMEAYAFDISVPGEGCVGKPVAGAEDGHGAPAAVAAATPTPTPVDPVAPAETTGTSPGAAAINPVRIIPAESTPAPAAAEPAPAGAPGQECHYHGTTLHCV